MSNPVVSAGTRIYVSESLPASNTASAFSALAWTKLTGVRVAGDVGNVWGLRDDAPIDSDYITKRKTLLTQSQLELQIITLVGDAGQGIIRDLSAVDANLSIKIERKDGGIRYFVGTVSTYRESQGGNGKQVFDATCAIDPQDAVIFV